MPTVLLRKKKLIFLMATITIFTLFLPVETFAAYRIRLPFKHEVVKILNFPGWLWTEFMAACQGISAMGSIRRFEFTYYHEHYSFCSEGIEHWGAPFTHLLIEPNTWVPKHWHYRVIAQANRFRVIAQRRRGIFKDREIWFDCEANGRNRWLGNYPLWPLNSFSFVKDYWNSFKKNE